MSGFEPALGKWQCFILCCSMGWKRKKDGYRRFRELFLLVPRKNAKSTLAAIYGNYFLTADEEEGAEIYSGATTEKQAWEVFRPAKLMVEKNQAFKDYYGVGINAKSINVIKTGSRFEPLIGDPGDGASPSLAIVDEFHEHQNANQYDTMLTGMGARKQPMLIIVSTAGSNIAGPCYDKQKNVEKVLEGINSNEELFGVIYTIDDDDDWTDLNVWKKANPNYDVSIFEDFLKARLREAIQYSSRQNVIKCKHLNIWVNAGSAYFNMEALKKCVVKGLNENDFRGYRCVMALDLASKKDISILYKMFEKDGCYYGFCKHYIPDATVRLPENDQYRTWEIENRLIVTP